MATYQSSYTGPYIDRAGKLPDPTSGSIGQFLRKRDSAGNMEFATLSPNIVLTDVTLSATPADWIFDNTYQDYPYVYSYGAANIQASYFPVIVFSEEDRKKALFAPFCETYNNGIKFYATSRPQSAVVIPTVIIFKQTI